jgi:hypothetical protein
MGDQRGGWERGEMSTEMTREAAEDFFSALYGGKHHPVSVEASAPESGGGESDVK